MAKRTKGDPKWKNRPTGRSELSKAHARIPLPANEQQRVDEFFDVLHALVYQRLGLREQAKGRDVMSGKPVATDVAKDGKRELARFDAELMVCMEKLDGISFLRALAQPTRQRLIAYEVRLVEAVLTERRADPAAFERNFATMFPTTTYQLSPELVELRKAIDAPDVQAKMSGRRPAIREAAAIAVSHLRGHTVRVRTIKEAQSVTQKAQKTAGVKPMPVKADAEWEIIIDGEPAKHIEWSDLISSVLKKKTPGDR